MTRMHPTATRGRSFRFLSRYRWPVLATIGLALTAALVLTLPSRADARTVVNGETFPNGFTVPAGETWTFNPNADTTIASGGNIIVRGTLIMKPANGSVDHVIRFTGINEGNFVGGGMDPVASDVGLWVVGAGRIILEGEARPAWAYSWQSSWRSTDEVYAAPNSPGSTSFTKVSSTPGKNALGYATELLNLTRNVRVEGTSTGYAHVFIRSTSRSSIKNAAFRYMGPDPANLRPGNFEDDSTGRYGLHIHMNGNSTRGMVVDGLVIRDTKAHAFVPHGSHGITFRNTIAFNVKGEAYWWDDPGSGMGMNESDDIVFDHTVAAGVTQASAGNNHRLGAYYLGAGRNPVVINSVAVGVQRQSGANRSGFIWPESSQGTWTFKNNRAHNNGGNGIFVWQNNEMKHVIDSFTAYYNGMAGVEHGAYTNSYVYRNLVLLGNQRAIHSHALGEPGDGGFTDTQIWSNIRTGGGTLYIDEHARPLDRPVRFVDCDLGRVVVDEQGGLPGAYDFIRCGLEPSDFDLSGAHPSSVFRVQRSNGTAYRLTGSGNVTTIPKFFAGLPPLGAPNEDEILFYRTDGTFKYYDMTPSAGLNGPIVSGNNYSKGWTSIVSIDLDGDSRDEMFFYRPDGTYRFYDMKVTGSLSSLIKGGTGFSKGWNSIASVDLDGDRRDEIFFYRADGTYRFYDVQPNGSLGSLISGGSGYSKGWSSITSVDVDGDRQDEMLFYRKDGTFRYYNVRANGSLGNPIQSGTGYSKGWDVITAVDVNGDHRDELFFYREDGSYRFYTMKSNGALGSLIRGGTGYSQGWHVVTSVDFNG